MSTPHSARSAVSGPTLDSFGVLRIVRLELRILPVLLNLNVKPEDLHLGKHMWQCGEMRRVRQIHKVSSRIVQEFARNIGNLPKIDGASADTITSDMYNHA